MIHVPSDHRAATSHTPKHVTDTTMSRPARRRGRPGHNRKQLLDTIVRVFTEYGYESATLELIAKHLGLSKSALYHHFDSKTAMLELALDHVLAQLEAVFDAPDALAGPASARIRFVVTQAVRVACEQHRALSLLLRLRGNSQAEVQAMQRRRAVDAKLRRLFEQSRREGTLPADIDPGLAERLTFGLINSIVEWYRPEGSLTPEALTEAVLLLLHQGFSTPKQPATPSPTDREAFSTPTSTRHR